MSFPEPIWKLILLSVVVMTVSGCAKLDVAESFSWPFGSEDEPEIPDKTVAIWSDTVLYRSNQPATRGFGGRLMFYNEEQEEPIKVDGTLVVYAFDEEGRNPDNVKPDRKFVFTPEQFAKHYSKSDIGHSYSIWLPWDEVGGLQKEVSLIARFMPQRGGLVIGKQSRYLLPGRKPPSTPESGAWDQQQVAGQFDNARNMRPVSYDAPVSTGPTAGMQNDRRPQQMQIETIGVPPRFSRKALGARAPGGARSLARRPSQNRLPTTEPVQPPGRLPPEASTRSAYPYPVQPAAAAQSRQAVGRAVGRGMASAPSREPSARFSRAIRPVPSALYAQPRGGHDRWRSRPVRSPYRREFQRPIPNRPGPRETYPNAGSSLGQPALPTP